MTDEQKFARLVEASNTIKEWKSLEEVDMSISLIDEDDVTTTSEPLKNFERFTKNSTTLTLDGLTLFICENVQAYKGARRGDLYLSEINNKVYAHFTGESSAF